MCLLNLLKKINSPNMYTYTNYGIPNKVKCRIIFFHTSNHVLLTSLAAEYFLLTCENIDHELRSISLILPIQTHI